MTRRGTLLREMGLVHDYFGNFSMRGEKYYFTLSEIEPMRDEIEMNLEQFEKIRKLGKKIKIAFLVEGNLLTSPGHLILLTILDGNR